MFDPKKTIPAKDVVVEIKKALEHSKSAAKRVSEGYGYIILKQEILHVIEWIEKDAIITPSKIHQMKKVGT